MITKSYDLTIDIMDKSNNDVPKIEVVQGDYKTNILNISLVAEGNSVNISNLTVSIAFKKSDGTVVLDTSGTDTMRIVNASIGSIECTLRTQAIASIGDVIATVSLVSALNEKLTSTEFKFKVRESIDNGDAIESTNDIPILTQLISTTQNLENTIETAEAGRVTAENTRKSDEIIRKNFYNEFKIYENYNNTKSYKIGNKVTYDGSSYYCIADCVGVVPTTVNNWIKIASKGDTGLQGIPGINWINAPYSGTTTYNINDALFYEGASYRCIAQSLNHLPTDTNYWAPISLQGIQGLKGDKPAHQWVGTSLQVENPDGSWGTPVNLKGADGAGSGDVTWASIDTDGDGVIDHAKDADAVPWAGIKNNPITYTPENAANKGVANGYAPLGADGIVPAVNLPNNLKEIKVVANIAARDALLVFEGLRVHVLDATADATVTSGWAEYLWTGNAWTKTAEKDSIDIVLDWANIQDKPSFAAVATSGSYNDLLNKPAIPTSLGIRGDAATMFRFEVRTDDPPFNSAEKGRAWYREDLDT